MPEGAALLDLSNEPATLTVNGATYTIRRMTIGDDVAIQQQIRNARMKAYLDLLNTTQLDDAVVSDGLARIANQPISKHDILSDVLGEVGMLQRGVTHDGKAVTTLPPLDRRLISHMLLWMSQVPPKEGADTGPFPDGSTVILYTRTGSSESPGTTSCPISPNITE
jgi:hypothetical protein